MIKIKLEKKRKRLEEEECIDYLKEIEEEVEKLMNKKRKRLALQVEELINFKIKKVYENAKIKLQRIDEDLEIEKKNKIERFKEIIEEEIIAKKLREKIRKNPKEEESSKRIIPKFATNNNYIFNSNCVIKINY